MDERLTELHDRVHTFYDGVLTSGMWLTMTREEQLALATLYSSVVARHGRTLEQYTHSIVPNWKAEDNGSGTG